MVNSDFKVNPARVKFKRGRVAKGAAGLGFEPQDVGERAPSMKPYFKVKLDS